VLRKHLIVQGSELLLPGAYPWPRVLGASHSFPREVPSTQPLSAVATGGPDAAMSNSGPDLIIVGGGPGGYVAALRAAQLGLRTVLVEKERPGGVCLNWGCIPTKAMLRSAEVLELVRHAKEFGVVSSAPSLDYSAVLERKDRIVGGLTAGVSQLLRVAGVKVITGHAQMTGPGAMKVYSAGQSPLGDRGPRYFSPPLTDRRDTTVIAELRAPHVLLATGSVPSTLPVDGADDPRVVTSDGAFLLKEVPHRVVVVGGSAVGVEWGTMMLAFGAEVTIVELAERLVPAEDEEVSRILHRSLIRRGIDVRTSTTVAGFVTGPGKDLGVQLISVEGESIESVPTDVVILGVGRRPNTSGLGLDRLGVEVDRRGFVVVDDRLETTVPGHYAVGDITGKAMLAHVASHQGLVAVAAISGNREATMSYRSVPAVTFCEPEIASVGMTEAAARADGHELVIGRFPFAASGRAQSYGATEGMVKVVAERQFGEILGMHIIGPGAAELIPEGVLAIELESTLDSLSGAIHAHPTLAEATMEASMVALGLPIHVPAATAKTSDQSDSRT
jgi:dihydrolipoamide dehydrogenase